MIGNSQLPGVATQPRHMARAKVADVARDLDEAMTYAAQACVAGQYAETLLPAWLWSLDKAAQLLTPVERHLKAVA